MQRFNDRSKILIEDVKTITGGYKVVRSKVARTGVQDYLARELGDSAIARGFKSNDLVSVYRPAEEVFATDSVNGWAGVPVTINHPSDLVSPENIKDYQVGNVRDKAHVDAASGWLGLEWMIQDAKGIAKFDSGEMPEVSGGYTAELVWGDGVAPDGRKYHVKQTKITPNHLAMVVRGRAFGDSAENWGASPVTVEDNQMTVELKTVILGDKAVQVEAKDADTVALILKDHKTAIDAKDAALAVKDAEIKTLKAQVLDEEKIEAMVEEKIGRKKKKEEVIAKVGDVAKDFSDEQIDVAHQLLDTAAFADNKARTVIGDKKTQVNDGVSAWDAIYGKGK